jgi:hypothetical protein
MVSDRAQFVVLCEDLQAEVFIRRVLVRRGAKPRRIRFVPRSSTGGAGHPYVVARYPDEVKAWRRQNARTATALVVHIDADPTHTVAERHAQLAAALKTAGGERRDTNEPIAELVPKRNIETWIYALDEAIEPRPEAALNEADEYPKLKYERACATAANAFADHVRDHTTPPTIDAVPSLRDGFEELGRLP